MILLSDHLIYLNFLYPVTPAMSENAVADILSPRPSMIGPTLSAPPSLAASPAGPHRELPTIGDNLGQGGEAMSRVSEGEEPDPWDKVILFVAYILLYSTF